MKKSGVVVINVIKFEFELNIYRCSDLFKSSSLALQSPFSSFSNHLINSNNRPIRAGPLHFLSSSRNYFADEAEEAVDATAARAVAFTVRSADVGIRFWAIHALRNLPPEHVRFHSRIVGVHWGWHMPLAKRSAVVFVLVNVAMLKQIHG